MKCPECGCKSLSSIIKCDYCHKEEKFNYVIDPEYPPNHWFTYKKSFFGILKHFCSKECYNKWIKYEEI